MVIQAFEYKVEVHADGTGCFYDDWHKFDLNSIDSAKGFFEENLIRLQSVDAQRRIMPLNQQKILISDENGIASHFHGVTIYDNRFMCMSGCVLQNENDTTIPSQIALFFKNEISEMNLLSMTDVVLYENTRLPHPDCPTNNTVFESLIDLDFLTKMCVTPKSTGSGYSWEIFICLETDSEIRTKNIAKMNYNPLEKSIESKFIVSLHNF